MGTLKIFSLIAAVVLFTFAALPGLASGQEVVVERKMGSWDDEMMKKFQDKGLDKAMYKKIFGKNMPKNVKMAAVNFKGELDLEKLVYKLPTTPFNWEPALGDEQDILNCGKGTIVSNVSLVTETEDKITHSFEDNITGKLTTEVSVDTEGGAEVPLVGKLTTKVGLKVTGEVSKSSTWSKGAEKTTRRTFTQEKSVTTAPNTLTRTQLIYQKFDVPGIPFEAKFYARGDMNVLFVNDIRIPVNSAIKPSNKNYCMRATNIKRSGPVRVWKCVGEPRQRWTYTGKIGVRPGELRTAGGFCLDVKGGSKWVKRNRNEQNLELNRKIFWMEQKAIRPDLHRIVTRKCNGGASQKWTLDQGKFEGGEYKNARFHIGNLYLDTYGPMKIIGKGMPLRVYGRDDGKATQKWGGWSGGDRAGTVKIEDFMRTKKDRLFEIKGNLKGTLNNNRSYFSVEDTSLTSKQCKKMRSGQGMQVASAGSIQTKNKADKKSVFVKRYRGKSLKNRKLNLRNIKFK